MKNEALSTIWELLLYIFSFLHLEAVFHRLPKLTTAPVCIKGRKYELCKQIGEGGYALVFLAREVGTSEGRYAVKKMHAPSREKLDLVLKEIRLHASLDHPNILRLIDYEVVNPEGKSQQQTCSPPSTSANGFVALDMSEEAVQATAYLLLPAYTEGTLAEEVEHLRQAGKPPLTAIETLRIFKQLCDALCYLHNRKNVAHRDIKPHNILISKSVAPATGPPPTSGPQSSMSYSIVLMDFGSASENLAQAPATRQAALSLQEEAEAHCTATYRAPELFDVPTGIPLDFSKSDIWALGCTLYHVMYGASPFQKAADQPGGSIALAALNCNISWPTTRDGRYPEALHDLVRACITVDPKVRPTAEQLMLRTELLLQQQESTSSLMPVGFSNLV